MLTEKKGIGHSKIIADFNVVTHEEWQKMRSSNYGLDHHTLGGSDAGVVMGVNKYKDLPHLYLEKTGAVDIPVDNEAVEWGHRLEPMVADKFADNNSQFEVHEYNYLLQHPDHKFMVANIDRLLFDEETGEYGILEIKTASEYVKGDWDNGNIPPSYYAQVQHYLSVTGLDFAYFAVLIGGNKYHQIEVERNDAYINNLIFQEEMFITRLIEGQLPELTGSDSSKQVVDHLFPEATEKKKVLTLSEEYAEMVAKRQELKDKLKEIEEESKALENKIKNFLGNNQKGTCQFGNTVYNLSWFNVAGKTTFDQKGFKEAYPDLFEQFAKKGKDFRSLRITSKEVE